MIRPELAEKIRSLPGPIAVLGALGFIGSNLMLALRAPGREDFRGFVRPWNRALDKEPWRYKLLNMDDKIQAFDSMDSRYQTIFNLSAYGAYPNQTAERRIFETNFDMVRIRLSGIAYDIRTRQEKQIFVHAGSSSEYGDNCSGPLESDAPTPNSLYACSKAAASSLIQYYGKHCGVPCCSLRLYSVYGPFEEPSRLIPQVIQAGFAGRFPTFVSANITRDFVYVDDVIEAFVDAALALENGESYGEIYNIGTGNATTIHGVSHYARRFFNIDESMEPEFSMRSRSWDTGKDWYADPCKAGLDLGWNYRTEFNDGLARTTEWWKENMPCDS